MKKQTLNIINTILFTIVLITLSAQENSISPIFALSQNNTAQVNTLASLNQVDGSLLKIENFSSENFIGKNYTVSTNESSNVDKLYLLNDNNNFSVYDIPYFFDPNYAGEKNEIIVASNVSDMDYHHQSTLIYSYDLIGQNLHTIIPLTGNIQTSSAIPFNVTNSTFSLKTTDEFVILSGKENGIQKILFHDIQNNTNSIINLTGYKDVKIISNHNFSMLYAIATDLMDKNWLLEINPDNELINTISSLPSCNNCSSESYNYDKNGLAIDWENNILLSILNQTINTEEKHFLLSIDLSTGENKYFVSLTKKTSNLYFNKTSTDLVFPGDTNHDGVVNLLDLFSIGLKYSFNTTARFTQGNQWIGQHSFNTGIVKQGADVKHADCNGDGQINSLDIEAIKVNYTYIHNSNKSAQASGTDCDYPLAISHNTIAQEGNDVSIHIKLGEILDTVTDVYGVQFTLNYNKNFVVPGSMHTDYFDSWFGIDGGTGSGGTFSRLHIDNWANGKIDIAVTGKNLMNRSGGGDIIVTAWTMEDQVVPIANLSEEMELSISNITIINYNEDTLESCGQDTTITVFHKDAVPITTIDNNEIEISPNPAHSFIKIKSDKKIELVEIFAITGEVVKTSTLDNSFGINVSNIAKGVYYVKVYTKEKAYLEKILIQ